MDRRNRRDGRTRRPVPEPPEYLEVRVLDIFRLTMTGRRVCQRPAVNVGLGIVLGATLAMAGMWALSHGHARQDGSNSRKHFW